MTRHSPPSLPARRALALLGLLLSAAPAGAASFVYEGRLDDGGVPAEGRYDFRLQPFAGERGGVALSTAIDAWGIEVHEGRFRVDFEAGSLPDQSVWLQLAVRGSDESAPFSEIAGRSKAIATALAGTCWSTTGDAGSDPAINFLGTTDAQPLVLRAGNAPALRIEPSSLVFGNPTQPITANMIAGSQANAVLAEVRGATIAGGGLPAGDSDPVYPDEAANRVTDAYGTVSGGYANQAGDDGGSTTDKGLATVGGGAVNVASGQAATIAGGNYNLASADYGVIGGGSANVASGFFSTIAGGGSGIASGNSSTIAGGGSNRATGSISSIGGGSTNTASGSGSTVGGGNQNLAKGNNALIGGGQGNEADGKWSSIPGGLGNATIGDYGSVGGGRYNCAGGAGSWAFGQYAKVRPGLGVPPNTSCTGLSSGDDDGDEGSLVWADAQGSDFVSTGPNQFLVRAGGGFALNTPAPAAGTVEMTVQTSATTGSDFANLWLKQRAAGDDGILISVGNGTGSNNAGFYLDHYNGSAQARRLELAASGAVIIRSNVTGANSGVTMAAGGGSFTSLSDRNLKTAIEAIDPQAILQRVAALPISTWSYIVQGTAIRHIGPMAQDFKAAFAVGESDTGITTIDADGVALAAIQGLNAKLDAVAAERDALATRIGELDAANARMAARLERLERALAHAAGAR